ncbi:MAG: hypothetical protein HY898_25320 [Deltaproteobacteria bacterium]|nr:hypothetical protein [Deltaproteobacteria bacterium]
MKGILALGASACAMLVAPEVAAADWYVDQAAAAGGDGTAAEPFKTW